MSREGDCSILWWTVQAAGQQPRKLPALETQLRIYLEKYKLILSKFWGFIYIKFESFQLSEDIQEAC